MQIYQFRSCLSIYHGADADRAKAHPHTVEIAVQLRAPRGEFQLFSEVEDIIGTYLRAYDNQFLNDLPEFHGDSSIENMGEVFFAGLTPILEEHGLTLQRLAVGETPLRQYVIGLLQSTDGRCAS